MNQNPLRDLPMGFGMALMQNNAALQKYTAMDQSQQQKLLDHTHEIKSKSEMKAFVDSIAFN